MKPAFRTGRQRFPKRIVWKQDDVTHDRFYWLAVPASQRSAGAVVEAHRDGQRIDIEKCDPNQLIVRLNDEFVDLVAGQQKFSGRVSRTVATISQTLNERGDAAMTFSAEVLVQVREPRD